MLLSFFVKREKLSLAIMGVSCSKNEGNKALIICKERMRYIKQLVDLRYALSAAQLSYTDSLRNLGISLGQFAAISVDLTPLNIELEQELSHSSYASLSPSTIPEMLSLPDHGVFVSPRLSNVSYMKAEGRNSVKFTVDSSANHYVEEGEIGSSWDFFDPVYAVDCINIPKDEYDMRQNFGKFAGLRGNGCPGEGDKVSQKEFGNVDFDSIGVENGSICEVSLQGKSVGSMIVNGSAEDESKATSIVSCGSNMERSERERRREEENGNSSMLIIHEAKDFLSCLKDTEQWFIRAAEAGHEVSRMLETKKIRLNIQSEILRKSSDSFLSVFNLSCCMADTLPERDTIQHGRKVVTWKRTVSSRSSSSRNPIASASKDDVVEFGDDFVEEFSMISGSHSSTLDRLYAWERKLYDELKASESIRKAYDQKCYLLRHQFSKGMSPQVIDKTRAVVKDLHSRVRVTIQAVDSISRRIEKLRDEELQPQLAELMQGLIRMWKIFLECHQAQHITISSAHHTKTSPILSQNADPYKQAHTNLQNEIECFRSSFITWIDIQKSYSESLNSWLQKCVLQPQERPRGRKVPFSPRRALAPPIFVLCRDWLAGIQRLPFEEVCDSLKKLRTISSELVEHQKDEKYDERSPQVGNGKGNYHKREVIPNSSLVRLQECLISTFECLGKFAEESVKVYEGVKKENQNACDAWFKL